MYSGLPFLGGTWRRKLLFDYCLALVDGSIGSGCVKKQAIRTRPKDRTVNLMALPNPNVTVSSGSMVIRRPD